MHTGTLYVHAPLYGCSLEDAGGEGDSRLGTWRPHGPQRGATNLLRSRRALAGTSRKLSCIGHRVETASTRRGGVQNEWDSRGLVNWRRIRCATEKSTFCRDLAEPPTHRDPSRDLWKRLQRGRVPPTSGESARAAKGANRFRACSKCSSLSLAPIIPP